MSCIDAAIIKALVEHIGMDPDSIGGSSDTASIINATWSTTHHVIKTATRVKDPIGHLNGKTIQKPISQHQFFQHDKFNHFHRVISCWTI